MNHLLNRPILCVIYVLSWSLVKIALIAFVIEPNYVRGLFGVGLELTFTKYNRGSIGLI